MTRDRLCTRCEDVDEVIVCRLCEDSWDKPTELQPCGHIFCESCVCKYEASVFGPHISTETKNDPAAFSCPTCSRQVERHEDPNRLLVNMALAVRVQCKQCEWKGTREQSWKHICPLSTSEDVVLSTLENTSMSRFQRLLDDALTETKSNEAQSKTFPDVVSEKRSPGLRSVYEEKWAQYGLSQAEYDQVMSVFMHFDTDCSGFLTRAQMRQLALYLNYASCEEDLARVVLEMDPNESGVVTIDDLCMWLGSHTPSSEALYGLSRVKYNEVLLQFRSYDVENKGMLEWEAFHLLCLNNNYATNEDDVWELFTSCADRSQGTVNLHQFLLLFQRLWGMGEERVPPPPPPTPPPQPPQPPTPPIPAVGNVPHDDDNSLGRQPPSELTFIRRRRRKMLCLIM